MTPAETLADAVRDYVQAVHGRSGITATVRIQVTPAQQARIDLDLSGHEFSESLTRAEEDLLEFIDALKPGEWLTAAEIADRMPTSDHSRFRQRLTNLAKQDLILSDRKLGYATKKIAKAEKNSSPK